MSDGGPGTPSDGVLVLGARGGDAACFRALYDRHARTAAAVARSVIHDPEAVADAVQDAFTIVLQRIDTLQDVEAFRAWLLVITRNAALAQLRSRRRVTVVDLDDPAVADAPDRGARPDELTELRELAQRVRGSIEGLSSRDALAVSLAADLGLRPPEIAAALGISVGAAKVVVHRARRRLRAAVESAYGPDVLDGVVGVSR